MIWISVVFHINPVGNDSTVVIPACLPLRRKGAGIQKDTGCRIKACPGLDPGSGMTGLAI
jgi:hypothetical protein